MMMGSSDETIQEELENVGFNPEDESVFVSRSCWAPSEETSPQTGQTGAGVFVRTD